MQSDYCFIPPRQLRALCLHLQRLSYADIGRRMGVSRQQAHRLVKKGMVNLTPEPARPRRRVWEIQRDG